MILLHFCRFSSLCCVPDAGSTNNYHQSFFRNLFSYFYRPQFTLICTDKFLSLNEGFPRCVQKCSTAVAKEAMRILCMINCSCLAVISIASTLVTKKLFTKITEIRGEARGLPVSCSIKVSEGAQRSMVLGLLKKTKRKNSFDTFL